MRTVVRGGSVALGALALWLVAAAPAQIGQGSRQGGSTPPPPINTPPSISDQIDSVTRDPRTDSMRQQQEKARNDDRQKNLVADTDKLLALATQLKSEVGKTDKNMLSIDVIRKADEIEKLAHSVKEKMKGG